jgi:hypothetical protein
LQTAHVKAKVELEACLERERSFGLDKGSLEAALEEARLALSAATTELTTLREDVSGWRLLTASSLLRTQRSLAGV